MAERIGMAELGNAPFDLSNIAFCIDGEIYDGLGYYENFDETLECLEQSYLETEKAMNYAYESIIETIVKYPRTMYFVNKESPLVDTEQLNLAVSVQNAWLDYREKECALSLSNADDTDLNHPYTKAEWFICMAVQAKIRLDSLKLYDLFRYPSPVVRG